MVSFMLMSASVSIFWSNTLVVVCVSCRALYRPIVLQYASFGDVSQSVATSQLVWVLFICLLKLVWQQYLTIKTRPEAATASPTHDADLKSWTNVTQSPISSNTDETGSHKEDGSTLSEFRLFNNSAEVKYLTVHLHTFYNYNYLG